jgi:hypothetical protein
MYVCMHVCMYVCIMYVTYTLAPIFAAGMYCMYACMYVCIHVLCMLHTRSREFDNTHIHTYNMHTRLNLQQRVGEALDSMFKSYIHTYIHTYIHGLEFAATRRGGCRQYVQIIQTYIHSYTHGLDFAASMLGL